METDCSYIDYKDTGYFSKIVVDYLNGDEKLQPFYQHQVSMQGVQAAIDARMAFNTNRTLLVDELRKQYFHLGLSAKQEEHLKALLHNNAFTITTAHQPNIFTGPLYFIYKIIHAIKLADELKAAMPNNHFVPVYYMGSEDADLDELGYVNVGGEKLVWNTQQTGAVGRMKVDKELVQLIHQIHGQIGVHSFGNEFSNALLAAYTIGKSIQFATLEFVNYLFAAFGLLVLIPDNVKLKASFNSVVEKELLQRFSHTAVAETVAELGKHYKVQAVGRDLNLFYLIDDKRERIEYADGVWSVETLGLQWNEQEVLQELQTHPERFSANVILRGAFQETILPNIAFIGGGGELAYWLELKRVFQAVQIPFPVLVLRNSYLLINHQQLAVTNKLGFTIEQLFQKQQVLIDALVKRDTQQQLSLGQQLQQQQSLYNSLQTMAGNIDATLIPHVQAIEKQAIKKMLVLEKKMLRAEKKKFDAQLRQIIHLRTALFPNDSLQERIDNVALFYAMYGQGLLHTIYHAADGFNKGFGVIKLADK